MNTSVNHNADSDSVSSEKNDNINVITQSIASNTAKNQIEIELLPKKNPLYHLLSIIFLIFLFIVVYLYTRIINTKT
jgi:hypothetical protein